MKSTSEIADPSEFDQFGAHIETNVNLRCAKF